MSRNVDSSPRCGDGKVFEMKPAFAATAVAAMLLCPAAGVFAQTAHSPKPYAELQTRAVKALSEQHVADLRAGRGMTMALPAELNGYPGPSHVLENADALGLSAAQRDRTEKLFAAMKTEAVPLGERLIQQEAALDRLFVTRTVAPASLAAATGAIGTTQGLLRAAHLRYHLEMVEVLTPAQVRRYAELRGYAGERGGGHDSHAR